MIVCTKGEQAPELPSGGAGGTDPLVVPILANISACGVVRVAPKVVNIWGRNSALAHIP
jgi:hypothetical protein